MKKLSLALAMLGLGSTIAYAGGIDYQEPDDAGVFTIGAEALYVRPTDGNFVYGIQGTSSSTQVVGRTLSNNPDFQWGYHLDIAYATPGDGPDISLGYTDLNTEDKQTRAALIGDADTARIKTTYDYTDIDLLIGKEFVLQNRYHFHPFAGLRYADIDSKDRAAYSKDSDIIAAGEVRNETTGVGPRAGVDAAVELSNGFSLVGRAAGSVLYSGFDWKFNGATASEGSVTKTAYLKNSDQHITVPEVDYRLGVNYMHEFSPETSFGVEIGWTAVQYSNVLNRNGNVDSAQLGDQNLSDWGFQGPYLRLQANIA